MSTHKEIVAYWLVPAEPAKAFFVDTIASLAARLDAVVFEPHVTIHVTEDRLEEPAIMLRRAFPSCSPYRLKVRNIDSSDEFTKTVFVQFESDARLTRLTENFRRASVSPSDYQLNPHLSLIYKAMDEETKGRLTHSITMPFSEVTFDTVKAIISPAEIKSREEVEAWRVVAERRLTR